MDSSNNEGRDCNKNNEINNCNDRNDQIRKEQEQKARNEQKRKELLEKSKTNTGKIKKDK